MLNRERPVEITINDTCTKCGLCTEVCAEYLQREGDNIKINEDSIFGCFQCGHCMLVCPNNAIKVKGEGISAEDVFLLNKKQADYDSLYSLLSSRRSTRKFKKQEVPQELIDKILQAASTGPISIPPSEVKVLVINGFDKVQTFADEIVNELMKMRKIMNTFSLKLFKFFMGKYSYKIFKEFVLPLIKLIIENRKKGKDFLFYNAPAVILFYTTPLAEKEDAVINATLAMTAAESLGLGSCVIGSVPYVLDNNSAKLKAKYGIAREEKSAMALILGYPEKKFSKGIKRRFKEVRYF